MKNTVKYGVEEFDVQVQDGSTFRQVLARAKAALGFGDNIKAMVEGVEMPLDATASAGQRIVVETACNSKAQDTKTVHVKYGVEVLHKQFDYAADVDEVVDECRIGLGYGDNIRASINGVEMPGEASVPNDATLVIETRCNSKAN